MSSSKLLHKIKSMVLITSSATALLGGYCFYKNDERLFDYVLMPLMRLFEAERSHELAVKTCKYKILPSVDYKDPDSLNTRMQNIFLKNPVGIAAGFDKNAEAVEGLDKIGFGFVEIGSVTPFPQSGNQKPRVFRLIEDDAIINRYGFNSDGHETVWKRLQQLRSHQRYEGVIGVNLGKNKSSEDAVKDYVDGVKLFGPVADYLVVNVSSPNTPGLRKMQQKDTLKDLLVNVVKENLALDLPRPIFLKLSPDLTDTELKDICGIIKKKECKVDGLIISNTTVDRSMILHSQFNNEVGGLSGKPLKEKSTRMISEAYKLTQGKIPIIGVGGVSSGQDVYEKIRAGASAVQIYTSFAYHGPPIVTKIKKELEEILKEQGHQTVQDAIGKGITYQRKSWFGLF
ncbi:CLUMA_CG020520, isoform A [Clunio marinus]|uniref:Dihydroorotate dehydrogenase (quinone), mitochondrial n=1 Tax=Clunio marinus TaxID=568069 RepID=A0A1J1J568_9DIPT|nr:CLUMA_CG020520, isoform A [Clunio marinus]